MNSSITVETVVNAPVEKVWKYFTKPEHIVNWNNPSSDWHTPRAENDLKAGGSFNYRMEAKDASAGFDFSGTYTEVVPHELIAYTIGDGRKVRVTFREEGDHAHMAEVLELEKIHSIEQQQTGWQAILDNFKSYVESQSES